MKKKNIELEYKDYPPEEGVGSTRNTSEWMPDNDIPNDQPNIKCGCGNTAFSVCWWDYPYTGGFCKIYCTSCDRSLVLIDDYA